MNIIIKKGIESQNGSNDSNYYPEVFMTQRAFFSNPLINSSNFYANRPREFKSLPLHNYPI